jgi:hypothetical protein
MALTTDIRGRVRKVLEAIDGLPADQEEQVSLSPQIEVLVAQAAAPFREIVRPGRAFQVHTTAAIGAVVAPPTTAAEATSSTRLAR